jgi:hypothetical protein
MLALTVTLDCYARGVLGSSLERSVVAGAGPRTWRTHITWLVLCVDPAWTRRRLYREDTMVTAA